MKFASSVDLDDAECAEFLYENFGYSGIETKEDAIKAIKIIDALPFIPVDGFEIENIELNYSDNEFWVGYWDKADESRFFGFCMSLANSDAEADRKAVESSLIELPDTRSPELKYLVGGSLNDPKYPAACGYTTNIRSHKIKIQTNNLSEQEVLDILTSCEFTTMSEYVKTLNP